MSEMNEINELLNGLQFFGMKESLEHRMAEARRSSLACEEFLTLILQDEKLYRINRKSEMLRKRAKFNDRVYLEDFEILDERGVTKSMINHFKSLYFLTPMKISSLWELRGREKVFSPRP